MNPDSKRIAWIETLPAAEVEGELAQIYRKERDYRTQKVDHILQVHSLHPDSLRDHVQLYHTTLHGKSGLSVAEREMIAVVVSKVNECHY
jgi:alkylhydroperoxidase family enzyme